MFGAADPDFLAVDDIVVALAPGESADARGIGACSRLGYAEGLKPQVSRSNMGQIARLLLGLSMAQDGTHGVHLGMRGPATAAAAVHFFEDRNCS
jgi:hypothetical protein